MTRDERLTVIGKARKANEKFYQTGGEWPPYTWVLAGQIGGLIEALEDAQAELDKWPLVPSINGGNPWDLVARAELSLSCGPYARHSGLAKELLSALRDALFRIGYGPGLVHSPANG